jgi:hypothetical protein
VTGLFIVAALFVAMFVAALYEKRAHDARVRAEHAAVWTAHIDAVMEGLRPLPDLFVAMSASATEAIKAINQVAEALRPLADAMDDMATEGGWRELLWRKVGE